MKVFLKLFGGFRNYSAPERDSYSFWLDLEEGARIEDILTHLGIPKEASKVLVLNQQVCKEDSLLSEGDVVAIFPPVDGG